jgi:hypothetical protein
MMFGRASAALFVVGLLAGSWADPGGGPPPARVNGYRVLAADLHVHGFFGDGALPPWEIRKEARRRGLDVVALSNHNQIVAGRIDGWLSGTASDPIVVRAEEITSRHYHLVAIGITKAVGWDQPAGEAIAQVHAQGGAAIAAHPIRLFWDGFDPDASATLDGAEIAHPLIDGSAEARAELVGFFRRTRERNPDLAPIGSTDFHFRAPMGRCRTYVFARDLTGAAIVEAVRNGRTVAYDSEGHGYGDPALVEATDRLRAAAAGTSRHGSRPLETASAAAALLGLAGLIVRRGK